jgi:hypothetical protein
MAIFTGKELLEKHGVTADKVKTVSTSTPLPTEQENTIRSRVGNVITNAGQNVRQAIQGEGQYAGQSPITRGLEATASAFNAVPQTVIASSPEPVRQGVEKISEVVGKGFNALTQLIGSNPELQKWTQEHPDATNKLIEISQGAVSAGQIAGTILGADKTAKTLQTGVDLAGKVTNKITQSSKEAFGEMGELRPTTQQIAIERGAKIRKGFEEQNTRLKSADASFNKNTITRKLPDGTKEVVTPIDTFAKHDIAPVIEKGSIQMGDYKTGTGPLGKIKEKVSALDNEIDTKLVNSGQKINLVELEKQALEAVKNNADLRQAGTVSSTMEKLKARFEDYRMSYGDDLDVAELNNIRKVSNRDWNVDTQDVSRVVGDVARNRVYDAVPDDAIRKLLLEQGELLSARNYAEKINGSKVTGGRVGNYVMRTGGAIIGSTVEKAPVIGPVAGMLGGEAIARLMQQSQFKSAWTELRSLIAKENPAASVVSPVNTKLQSFKAGNANSQGGYIANPFQGKPKPKVNNQVVSSNNVTIPKGITGKELTILRHYIDMSNKSLSLDKVGQKRLSDLAGEIAKKYNLKSKYKGEKAFVTEIGNILDEAKYDEYLLSKKS